MKKKGWKKICLYLIICLAGGLLLDGCIKRDSTKTIVLDEGEQSLDSEYAVKNIKEYYYEGNRKEEGWMAWEQDSENMYLLKAAAEGYEYQKFDVGRGKILSSIPITDAVIGQVKIAPGGEYIAYERKCMEGWEFVLYLVETDTKLILGEASSISFSWSGDGKKLFYTFIVDEEDYGYDIMAEANYGYDSSPKWCFYYCDMSSPMDVDREVEVVGYAGLRKNILPNEDGSRIYVSYEDVQGNNEPDKDLQCWEFFCENFEIYLQQIIGLPEGITRLVRYTDAGLFVQDGDKRLFLVTEFLEEPQTKQIAEPDSEDVFICENGSHIFVLKQEESTKHLEIRSLYLKNGVVVTEQLLYKDVYRSRADAAISMDDSAIALKSIEYLGEKKYSYKVTVLEYEDDM